MSFRRRLVGRIPPRARQLINARRGIDQPLVVDSLPADRVLVLAPHPDDEVIGCGGAAVGHRRRDTPVTVAHVTSGERTWSMPGASSAGRAEVREAEAIRAAAVLGIERAAVQFWRLADGSLAAEPTLPERVRAALDEVDPDLVYAPWPLDAHGDHRALTRALAAVCGPDVRIGLYEVWGPLVPTHIVDVTDHLETKLQALDCYQGALSGIDYRHTARGLAAYRSGQGMGGKGYAEAFCVVTPAQCRELAGS